MIQTEDLQNIVGVIETHLVSYSNSESTYYARGSYFKPIKYRTGSTYLELYYFILKFYLDVLEASLNYEDFGVTTDQLVFIIDKSNELIFYYGD